MSSGCKLMNISRHAPSPRNITFFPGRLCSVVSAVSERAAFRKGPSSFLLSSSLPCSTIFFILWFSVLCQCLIIDIITKHSVAGVNSPHPPALLVFPALQSMSDGEQLVLLSLSRCSPSSGWLILKPDLRPLARGALLTLCHFPNCPQVCLQRQRLSENGSTVWWLAKTHSHA